MKTLITIALFVLSFSGYAQEAPHVKELGITFSNLNNFGATYRFGTTKSLWRLGTIGLTGSSQNQATSTSDYINSNASFGLRAGKEFRKALDDKFSLRFGADIGFNIDKSVSEVVDKTSSNINNTYSKTFTYGPRANLIFGLNYQIKKLIIGAELLPYISYNSGKRTERNYNQAEAQYDISSFSYGINSSSVLMSIVYQF